MSKRYLKNTTQFLALYLSLAFSMPTPSFALRQTGLEEQTDNQGNPLGPKAELVTALKVSPRSVVPSVPFLATAGMEELKGRFSIISDQDTRGLAESVYDVVATQLDPGRSLERNLRAVVQAVAQAQSQHPGVSFAWTRVGTKGDRAFIAFEARQVSVAIWFDQGAIRDVALQQEAAQQLSYTALLGGQVGPKEFSEEFKQHHPGRPKLNR